MSNKAKKVIKDVNATMRLENMPLTDREKNLLADIVDGIKTADQVRELLRAEFVNA